MMVDDHAEFTQAAGLVLDLSGREHRAAGKFEVNNAKTLLQQAKHLSQ